MANFISVFSGAGGLDLGLERGGWDCLYATDRDLHAVATLRKNRGRPIGRGRRALTETVTEAADIADLKGVEILSKIGRFKGDLDLLAGGPPCQSWSSAGHQRGFDDPRGRVIADYLRLANELDPRWLLFENVRGLLTARGWDQVPGSALASLRQELLHHGWHTRVDLLNAADFGVPQRRVRLILLGFRAGDGPDHPSPTHAQSPSSGMEPWKSLGDCLKELERPAPDEVIKPSEKLHAQLALLEPGTGVKSPGKTEATRPGGHWGYKQGAFLADPSLPARTVTASAQQDWVRDEVHGIRRLSDRECAALQSFPTNWEFEGSRTTRYRLIGNAVPPILAEAVGGVLKSALAGVRASGTLSPALEPLPPRLQSAISYTVREDRRNGPSRREAPARRRVG